MVLGSSWLSKYATRIQIGLDVFVIPVMILAVIAALTVTHKIFTTAQANPVDSLKKE
jgi:putative ABC transport system permease protein